MNQYNAGIMSIAKQRKQPTEAPTRQPARQQPTQGGRE